MKWSMCTAVVVLVLAGGVVHAEEKKADAPSYTRDVKPFLAKYCGSCHNATTAKSGYNFEDFDALMKGGKKGAAVVAGDADKSMLVRTLAGKAKKMPPAKYSKQPKAEEIDLVKAWIIAGAKNDGEKSGAAATEPARFLAQTLRAWLNTFTPEVAVEPFVHE